MTVYIVTDTQLGWDCVIGTWLTSTVTRCQLEQQFPSDDGYVITKTTVHTSLEEN